MVRDIGKKLQLALEAGQFEVALPLIEEYGRVAKQAMLDARDDRARAQIVEETSSFLQGRLHLARVVRSHLSSRLATNSRVISYDNAPSGENTWQIEA